MSGYHDIILKNVKQTTKKRQKIRDRASLELLVLKTDIHESEFLDSIGRTEVCDYDLSINVFIIHISINVKTNTIMKR